MSASRSLYRVLLRLSPADFRAEFGAEMEALFLADLDRARGLATVRVWARAAGDVLRWAGRTQRRLAARFENIGVRRLRRREIVDGHLAIRPPARVAYDVAAARHHRDHPADPVALIAVTVPALRAMRIDPVAALRSQ